MNLLQASHQWSTRPVDERFFSIREMRDVCRHYADIARETSANPEDLNISSIVHAATHSTPQYAEPVLRVGSMRARFTNWSFGQLCRTIGAPADYLRGLPVALSLRNLHHGIEQFQKDSQRKPVRLLTHQNGDTILRAITSVGYSRIWNWEVADRLLELPEGWMVPPARPAFEDQPGSRPATKEDIVPGQESFGLSVKVGDLIAPAGVYASDHDMFCFLLLPAARVADGTDLGLMKGIFVSNSEVGAQSLKITKFRFRAVCSNHICWDASHVVEIRIIHRGKTDGRFIKELSVELQRYGEEGVEEEEVMIRAAQRYTLGKDKDEVLNTLFGIRNLGPTLKQLEAAYNIAESNVDTDGAPTTAWGMVNGLTRLSQQIQFMDQRSKVDRAAGKILEMVTK